MSKRFVIGIDPDSDKSGIGVVDTELKKVVYMDALRFPRLITAIRNYASSGNGIVYVEAGWLNASNWHTHGADSPWLAAKKGQGVGMNQQTGKLIIEMLEAEHIAVKPIKPLRKFGKAKDRKISHTELQSFLGRANLAFAYNRSNQEMRDAVLIGAVNSCL